MKQIRKLQDLSSQSGVDNDLSFLVYATVKTAKASSPHGVIF